jgi:hypothetical protein
VCRSRSSTPYGSGIWGCFTTPSGTTTSSEARLLAYPSGSPSATVTADICPLGGRRSAAVGALCSRLRSTSRYSGCTTARGIVACVADRTACGAPMALPISISISILIPMYPDPDPDVSRSLFRSRLRSRLRMIGSSRVAEEARSTTPSSFQRSKSCSLAHRIRMSFPGSTRSILPTRSP